MYIESIPQYNGDIIEPFDKFACDSCGKILLECWPRVSVRLDADDVSFFVNGQETFNNLIRALKRMGWSERKILDTDFCVACAFKMELISGEQYVDLCGGFTSDMFHAAVNPYTNDIEIAYIKNKFSWERTNKDWRNSHQNTEWRQAIFERDNYTCQRCNKRGGSLNAHHIKPFATHPELRFEVANGITLCRRCHLAQHRKQ